MIVFERFFFENGRNGTDVVVANADGSGEKRLTYDLGHMSPAWSRGGGRIVFRGWVGSDYDGNYEIQVMNVDGSEQLNLSRSPASQDGDPVWSPASSKILFQSGPSIHVINPDGRRHRNLTRGRRSNGDATWSRDGRMIVFRSTRDGNSDIYVMTASGGNPTNLTNTSTGTRNTSPSWSP